MRNPNFRKVVKTTEIEEPEIYQGESIEDYCARVVETNEAVEATVPMQYTDKKDGVLPQYDVRTDRWEIAQNAMDLATRSAVAKSEEQRLMREQKVEVPADTSTNEKTQETNS